MANRLLTIWDRVSASPTQLDAQNLMRRAQKRTGHNDFGPPGFQEALQVLIDNINQTVHTPLGRRFLKNELLRSLSNRLECEAHLKMHPEIEEEPITPPVFIVGLPRSGTTAVHNMLGCLDSHRCLKLWELHHPIPGAVQAKKWASRWTAALLNFGSPEQRYIHAVEHNLPDECWRLMLNSFSTLVIASACDLKDYQSWLLDHDMSSAYNYYRRLIKIIQRRKPEARLILKSPEHLWHLSSVVTSFPDAKIIWTHRDPHDAIASYSSLVSLSHRALFEQCNLHKIGQAATEIYRIGLDRAMAFRQTQQHHDRFLDLHCNDIATNPLTVIETICSFLGRDLSRHETQNIKTWLDSNRSDRIGTHRYEPTDFGIHKSDIDRQFADYRTAYNIDRQ